jgi:AcrR family transcriptional regulator
MKRKLTARGKERRSQLMDEAARLFAERGYHPTSVADVVEALGVGKGVFYWYFASKEELFIEILKSAQTDLRRRQQAAIGDEPHPVRRIELGLRASMAWFAENRAVFNLFQFAATEERFAPTLRRGQEVAIADVVRHLKDAMVDGHCRDQDPTILAVAITGVTGALARNFILEGDGDLETVTDAAVTFSLHGILN